MLQCRPYTPLVGDDSRQWLADGISAAYTRCVTETPDRSQATLERLLRRHVTVFQVPDSAALAPAHLLHGFVLMPGLADLLDTPL